MNLFSYFMVQMHFVHHLLLEFHSRSFFYFTSGGQILHLPCKSSDAISFAFDL